MPYPDEIVTLIETSALGTFGTDLIIGTKADWPKGAGPYTRLIETGGSGPEWTQDRNLPAYRLPGLQVTVIGSTIPIVKARAEALWLLLVSVQNVFLSGIWYIDITPLNEPHDMGPAEGDDRPRYQFNVLVRKRTDVTSSGAQPPDLSWVQTNWMQG